MPLISVIIPAYNHADTIARCLDSVFSQTILKNRHREAEGRGDLGEIASSAPEAHPRNDDVLEVVVVNDGSTDGTDEAVKPYLDKITYKKIANSGAPKARNTGFELSHGRFVIFCDADMILRPNMLQLLYEKLKTHPDASYSYGGFRFGLARFKGLVWNEERLRKINYIHTSALIRREAFVGFDENIKKFQDWDLWLTMLEKGKSGVAVNKILFSAKPRRDGMSYWIPKMFYSSFFTALGIRFKSVIRYRHAADIIAKKHGLNLDFRRNDGSWLWFGFIAIFVISAISFTNPWLGTAVSLLFLVLAVIASLNQLIYGAMAVLAEIIFGSLAGKTLALEAFGIELPLRIVLFTAILLIWLVRLLQGRVRRPQTTVIIGVLAVFFMVGWGMINGLLHNISFGNVFSDANAYLALPIILIFASAIKNEQDQLLLKKILKHGVIALSIITIGALYFFSHQFWNPAGVFGYKWLRDTRIAEITALNGGLYRIFIQSQIFCVLVFLMTIFDSSQSKIKKCVWVILPATALIISGSRSFALGIIVATLISLIIFMVTKIHGREFWGPVIKGTSLAFVSVIIFLVALYFPLPAMRSQTSFQDMLRSRSVSDRDAATTSRWALLKELDSKILEAPILGSGFGTTVTYHSSDPRILSTTGGSYTTAAFEWNYHDILVKTGILGLLAYVYLLYAIFTVINKAEPRKRIWLLPAFIALLAINIVSPFLNHPLGIVYLALLLALAESKKGEPVAVTQFVKIPNPSIAAIPAGISMAREE